MRTSRSRYEKLPYGQMRQRIAERERKQQELEQLRKKEVIPYKTLMLGL